MPNEPPAASPPAANDPPTQPKPYVAAADVGGTRIKAALVTRNGSMLRQTRTDTGSDHHPASVLSRVRATLADLQSGQPFGPVAVGVAMCGLVDDELGISLRAANLGWRDVPVRALLQTHYDVPVAVIHDVRAGGLAEHRLGAARGAASAIFLPIGTGIAAALIQAGQVISGAHHMAGEIGHLPAVPDGLPCRCGATGCLETVASAPAIARSYAELAGEPEATAATVASRAASGDALAAAVWHDAVTHLGRALAAAIAVLDPAITVVGGGLALAGQTLLQPLTEAVAAQLPLQPAPRIAVSQLAARSGCMGAALAAWEAAPEAPEVPARVGFSRDRAR